MERAKPIEVKKNWARLILITTIFIASVAVFSYGPMVYGWYQFNWGAVIEPIYHTKSGEFGIKNLAKVDLEIEISFDSPTNVFYGPGPHKGIGFIEDPEKQREGFNPYTCTCDLYYHKERNIIIKPGDEFRFPKPNWSWESNEEAKSGIEIGEFTFATSHKYCEGYHFDVMEIIVKKGGESREIDIKMP